MGKITPESYIKLYQELGSHAKVSRYLSMNEAYLRKWRKKYGVLTEKQAHVKITVENEKQPSVLSLLPYLKNPCTIGELSEKIDKSIGTIEKWLDDLSSDGYNITQQGDKYKLSTNILPSETRVDRLTDKTHLKIGIISDTHLCSTCQQLTHLNHFYDICQDEGITDIYHAGDILAGVGVYPGQDEEIFEHTEDTQIDYVVSCYPQREGITTHVIAGNHDLVFLKRRGSDPVRQIANRRDDIDYLGAYSAWIRLTQQCLLYLLHPDGGICYADSYTVQKLIESFEGGRKPNITVMGHYHRYCIINSRNVYGVLGACFESQTTFLRRKKVHPRIGGIILEINFNDDGSIQRFKEEFINFLVPVEHDY